MPNTFFFFSQVSYKISYCSCAWCVLMNQREYLALEGVSVALLKAGREFVQRPQKDLGKWYTVEPYFFRIFDVWSHTPMHTHPCKNFHLLSKRLCWWPAHVFTRFKGCWNTSSFAKCAGVLGLAMGNCWGVTQGVTPCEMNTQPLWGPVSCWLEGADMSTWVLFTEWVFLV